MDEEFFAEMGVPTATEITCDECGADIDVSDAVTPDEMFERVTEHGVEEHDWGTEKAGLRHIVTRFGELALDCREELEALALEDYERDIYGDDWGAALAHEEAKFTDEIRLSTGPVNTDDILARGSHDPTRFRRELVTALEEAHTKGATSMGLADQLTSLTELIAQQQTEDIVRWAARGGEYRAD